MVAQGGEATVYTTVLQYTTSTHTHAGHSENIEITGGYKYSYKCLIEKVRLRFEFTDLSLSMRGCWVSRRWRDS